MNIKNKVIQDFYSSTKSAMVDFIEYLPAILPVDEDDAKTLSIALDMVKQLKSTLENAESVKDLENVVDLELLQEDWVIDQNNLMVTFSADSYDAIKAIENEYRLPTKEDNDT